MDLVTIVAFFQSSNRVNYYLERPHVTKLDEISAINLRFPVVTICNLNEFRFSQITRYTPLKLIQS